MAKTQQTVRGTVLKMLVSFDYPADRTVTLDNIEWYTEWFCDRYSANKCVKLQKSDHVREYDEQTGKAEWYALVDTKITGKGKLYMRLWAEIPDEAAPEGIRIEYVEVQSDVPPII